MADKPDEGPSLEMPSFSLRRKKKQAPEDDVAPEPAPTPEPTPEPEPEPEPLPEPVTVEPLADEPTATLPVPTPAPEATREPAPAAEAVTEPEPVTVEQPVDEQTPDPVPAEPKRRRERPSITLPGLPAAAITGVVVGALAVLLAWLAGAACSAVRGTSSCGGAAGLPLLLVGLVVLAYAGSVLLGVLGVRDAGSTSLLGVGILSVLVLVFLLGSTDEWWIVLALPVAAVIAYCASWWVTTAVVGDEPEPTGARTPYDVR
jgi:hypothetical protein